MKTFVKAKADYGKDLTESEFYEVILIIDHESYTSGKCVIIENDAKFVVGYDMEMFFN